MAFLLHPATRRQFLATAAGSAAANRLAAAGSPVRWALLSDTHAPADPADSYRGFKPLANLRQVVAQVAEWAPDSAYVNGDLARQSGTEGEYASFRDAIAPLASKIPLALGLGNHDHRDQFLKSVKGGGRVAGEEQPLKGKYVTVVDSGPVRFVFLDSLFILGQVPGLLGKTQREWLDGFLGKDSSRPVLLFVHHTLGDDDGGLLDAERFLRIATARRNVKAVFYGHSHQYKYDILDGVHLVNLPAVGYNFADNQPVGWVAASITAEGADLKLRAIGGNTADDGKSRSLAWR